VKRYNLVPFAIVAQSVVFQHKFESPLGEKRNFLFLLEENIRVNYNNLFA
jgi:hypothetical protein